MTGAPPARAGRWGARHPVLILTYHSVRPRAPQPSERAGWLDWTRTTIDVESFRQQMAYVARRYHTLTLEQVIDARATGGELPANPCVITFDDGLADVRQHAVPVLRELGLTATFFVVGEPIRTGEPAWIHAMYQLVEALGVPQCVAALGSDAPALARARRVSPEELLAWIRRQLTARSRAERQRLLSRLLERLGGQPAKPLAILGAAELRDLAAQGFEIGAHSMAHEPLAALSAHELDRDLADSRATLTAVLGREPRAFCYPFGEPETWSAQVVAGLRRHGFRCACTTVWGLNDHASDPFALRRIDSLATPTLASFVVRTGWARIKWRLRRASWRPQGRTWR